MNGARRASQALWLMLTVSAGALLFFAASNYASCRTNDASKLGCFLWALFLTPLEALALVVVTAVKLLMLVLP